MVVEVTPFYGTRRNKSIDKKIKIKPSSSLVRIIILFAMLCSNISRGSENSRIHYLNWFIGPSVKKIVDKLPKECSTFNACCDWIRCKRETFQTKWPKGICCSCGTCCPLDTNLPHDKIDAVTHRPPPHGFLGLSTLTTTQRHAARQQWHRIEATTHALTDNLTTPQRTDRMTTGHSLLSIPSECPHLWITLIMVGVVVHMSLDQNWWEPEGAVKTTWRSHRTHRDKQ